MSRQYLTAGKCVEAVLFGNQPFKRYCANMKIVGKEEYLLAAETLKYADVLQQLCDRCGVVLKKLEVIKGTYSTTTTTTTTTETTATTLLANVHVHRICTHSPTLTHTHAPPTTHDLKASSWSCATKCCLARARSRAGVR